MFGETKRKAKSSWKQPVVISPSNDAERKLAKVLARHYYEFVKGTCIHAEPWHPGKDITDYPVLFSAFVQTARVVTEFQADPKKYVLSQFQEFVPGKYPFPQQLHTANACARYSRYLARVSPQASYSTVKDAARKRGENEWRSEDDRVTVYRLQARLSSDDEVFEKFARRFSRGYLKHRGVWERFRSQWEGKTL